MRRFLIFLALLCGLAWTAGIVVTAVGAVTLGRLCWDRFEESHVFLVGLALLAGGGGAFLMLERIKTFLETPARSKVPENDPS